MTEVLILAILMIDVVIILGIAFAAVYRVNRKEQLSPPQPTTWTEPAFVAVVHKYGREWSDLALYNGEVHRGIVHTPKYHAKMHARQAEYDIHLNQTTTES
jgi:hypothetical protein